MAANVNMKTTGPNANDRASPLDDPEVINSLAGSVRWVLDLLAWLTDTLLTLPSTLPSNIDLTNPSTLSLPALVEHLHATNTISLHLLLSSSTRGFLTAICRRLSHLDYIARKAIAHTNQEQSNSTLAGQDASKQNGSQQQQPQNPPNLSPALRSAYYQIATLTSATNIRAKTFETLLSSLTSLVKTAYASHQPPLSGSPGAEKTRNQLEIKMLLAGQLPDAFKPVIVQLFKGISAESPNITASRITGSTGEDDMGLLAAVREEIEPARLWFADFTMLEVDEDPISVQKRKSMGMTMDCFRKAWLVNPKGKAAGEDGKLEEQAGQQNGQARTSPRWRRCARCTATMEDALTQRPALQWLVMQQRRCYCSGYWDSLEPGQATI